MEIIQIVKEVILKVQENFDKELSDEIGKLILKTIADNMGVDYISTCITPHPTKGYFVNYSDDLAPKLFNDQYINSLKKNTDLINNIISKHSG